MLELLVIPESWGGHRDDVRSDVQAWATLAGLREMLPAALAALSRLAADEAGTISSPAGINVEGLANSEWLADRLDTAGRVGVLVAWERCRTAIGGGNGGGGGPRSRPDQREDSMSRVASMPAFFRLGVPRLPGERIYGWGDAPLAVPGMGTQSYLFCAVISLSILRLEVLRGRGQFVVANWIPMPPLQAHFWFTRASETIDLLADHLARLPVDSAILQELVSPVSWGDLRDHLRDELQEQVTSPRLQRSLEALLVNLAQLPESSVGPLTSFVNDETMEG